MPMGANEGHRIIWRVVAWRRRRSAEFEGTAALRSTGEFGVQLKAAPSTKTRRHLRSDGRRAGEGCPSSPSRRPTMKSSLLRAALVAAFLGAAASFAPRRTYRCTPAITRPAAAVRSGASGDDGGIEDFEAERMTLVRKLQESYYREAAPDVDGAGGAGGSRTASAEASGARLDAAAGKVRNLPLWRVGWVEVPGRRNCLNVHEAQYTHMFETILSRGTDDGPRYFGHLYLPGGTKASASGQERYRLKTWREELADEARFEDHSTSTTRSAPEVRTPRVDRSAVVGCLMEVVDHRRMEDGRLTILVQALERFAVDEVVNERPYAVADVQILLDEEELPWERGGRDERSSEDADEDFCAPLRGGAVAASFEHHRYEFDRPRLPTSGEGYLADDDVPWLEIAKLLPFARYSSDETGLGAADDALARLDSSAPSRRSADRDGGTTSSGGEPPLERTLRSGGVLWDPQPLATSGGAATRRAKELTCDELEALLWLALDDFSRATGFDLPEEITCLLPPEIDYLDVRAAERVSDDYPKLRRQKRLSYLAPALIENLEDPMKGMRQSWLNAPSIRARLAGALERYDCVNDKIMGRFE
ncbi:hypothetical protein ACHAWF_016579 [Thalassiosira exigua]